MIQVLDVDTGRVKHVSGIQVRRCSQAFCFLILLVLADQIRKQFDRRVVNYSLQVKRVDNAIHFGIGARHQLRHVGDKLVLLILKGILFIIKVNHWLSSKHPFLFWSICSNGQQCLVISKEPLWRILGGKTLPGKLRERVPARIDWF